jgi:hypothetical protein
MSNGETADWSDEKKKTAAILSVLRHIAGNQGAGQNCIGKDEEAHKLFEDPTIGNIAIPPGGRVVVLATGEQGLKWKGSVIIEMPEPPVPPKTAADMTDRELLSYVLGNYKYWPPE